MWISRERYEQLIQAAAETAALKRENGALLEQIERERHRAENAVDALLVAKSALPITPPAKESKPEVGMFDDDPEELERILKEMRADAAGTLIREGVGGKTHA